MAEPQQLLDRIAAASAPEHERLAAERELCLQLAPRIRLYGLRHLRDEAAAADLVQEVLLIVLRSARDGRIEDPHHVERFAFGTCRNLVARIRREQRRTKRLEVDGLPLSDSALPPAFTQVDVARLVLCLGRASAREQRVVLLTFQEERTPEEIAKELGTSAGNVRVLRHRVLAALQRCIDGGAS